MTSNNKKPVDTGAGFFLDEEDIIEEKKIKLTQTPRKRL
jgi:hypothetical protein